MADTISPIPWPDPVTTERQVATIESLAHRTQTPCGDGSIVWHIWGDDATGSPVVLLHGGSGSWTHWVRNIGALVQSGRRVLVPDMPGFGDSAAPPDGHDADVLPRWIDLGLSRLIGDSRCDLVGFSFGGLAAGLMASTFHERVARLVLVGAPALSDEVLAPIPLEPWQHLPEGPQREAAHRHNLGVLMLAQPASIDPLAVTLHAANVVRDRMRKRRLMLTDALVRALPQVVCPVWGIWGAEDMLYRQRRELIGRALAEAPDFRSLTMIPQAGHWVQYERADETNRALAAALR